MLGGLLMWGPSVQVDVWDEDRTDLEGNEGILGTVLGPGSYSKAIFEKTVCLPQAPLVFRLGVVAVRSIGPEGSAHHETRNGAASFRLFAVWQVRTYTRGGFFGERAFMVQGDFRDFALEPLVGVPAEFNVYLYDGPHAEQVRFSLLSPIPVARQEALLPACTKHVCASHSDTSPYSG
jgi:hypothetical protein